MNKRILIVGQHFWPESFRINDISDFLVNEKGCDVDVLCGLPNYPSGKFPDGYGYFKKRHQTHNHIRIHRALEIPRGNNSNWRIFLNYISFPITSLFHVPHLLFNKYDKIFIYQLSPVMMSIAGIVIGKLKRTETTMYVLDLWPENLFSVLTIRSRFLRKLARSVSHWHYRKADKLVALSEKMKQRLIDASHIKPENITVLPQSCEKLYETDVHDKDLEKRFSSGFNILFAGNISPAQSFETMIAAAAKLKADGLDDIRWIIVGDGMSRKQIEADIEKLGLSGSFVFEGMKPMGDIPKYSTMADLLVGCLVKSELLEATIPAKVMSYLASGKPIALAMDGEVQDLINNKVKSGYVGDAGDADALYKNIKKIYYLSQKERDDMGARSRAYHFKHFERSIVLNELYKFIFK